MPTRPQAAPLLGLCSSAQSSAQRQAAYRARNADRYRLDVLLGAEAGAALASLCARHGVSRAAMIERLLKEAQNRE